MRTPKEIILKDGKSLAYYLELHKTFLDSQGSDGKLAELDNSNLKEVDLSGTNLKKINLSGAILIGANLRNTILNDANLSNATIHEADLSGSDLHLANLFATNLNRANLLGANLSNANLTGCLLSYANLAGANLNDANLSEALLYQAYFSNTLLNKTNFQHSILEGTIFCNLSLTETINIDRCRFYGPSIVDINSIPDLDKLPKGFLKGVGFSDQFINTYKAIFSGNPIEFYSCFISFSSKDQEFAERLHADLNSKRIRTWFAPEDLKIGEKIREVIDKAIINNDKLMLILSEKSINSQWVEGEVESALEKERKTGKIVLFPIRIDNSIFNVEYGWAKLIKNSRNIGDFSHWKDQDVFKKSFERLIRDLKAEEND